MKKLLIIISFLGFFIFADSTLILNADMTLILCFSTLPMAGFLLTKLDFMPFFCYFWMFFEK